MPEITTKELLRMNRRRFLGTLANLGVAGTGLQYMTKEALAKTTDDPENEVPRLFGWRHTNHNERIKKGAVPEREAVYYTISREKWARVESAHNARKKVSQILNETFEFVVPAGVQTRSHQGNRRKEIGVEYRVLKSSTGEILDEPDMTYDKFEDIVLEKVGDSVTGIAGRGTKHETRIENIPVTIEKTERIQDYSYDYEYRDLGVPAGCVIRQPDGGVCTLGTLVYDSDISDNVMVTAGHCLQNINDVYQNDPNNDELLGNVNQGKLKATGDFDAGIIDDLEFNGIWSFAADSADSYQGPTIWGTTSKSVMKDKEGDQSWTIHKQGAATARSDGYIDKVYDTDFRTTTQSQGGDSGGPVWRTDSLQHAWMLGIHGGHTSNYAYHTIMESIEDEFNVTT